MNEDSLRPYLRHLRSSADLVTTYEATRAGFVALALERNRQATPYVEEARALQTAASQARTPAELPGIKGIEAGLLTAAGLSDKALAHLQAEDKAAAIAGLIEKYLEPAGTKFVEELVFRFLLTRGDSLGGAMRNIGGALAQRKLTRAILSTLAIAGIAYRWQHAKSRQWINMSRDDSEIELALRGLSWRNGNGHRTLMYNLNVPLIKNNVDLCLFDMGADVLATTGYRVPERYLALGELKGGIDPAGADEHWKTARTALDRIRDAFARVDCFPDLFFVGAAIEQRMAAEIWRQLEERALSNAANLNEPDQIASLARWLCAL